MSINTKINSLSDVRVIMLCDNEFTNDQRIYREARSISNAGYDLTLWAVQKENLPDNDLVDGIKVKRQFDKRLFFLKSSIGYLREMADKIIAEKPHIIHCHDWLMLHLGVLVKKKMPEVIIIYDSHELFKSWPIHYSNRSPKIIIKSWLVRKFEILREWRDRKYIDYVITVSESIADILADYLKVKNKICLVRNFAVYEEITDRRDYVREKFNIPTNHKIVVLFAYLIYRNNRNIEQVISEFANKDGVSFVIFCKNAAHKEYFVDLIKKNNITNIFLHDIIKSEHIVNYLASCDIGIITTWNKKYMSYWLGLENKLFHYIMSELPILASAQPEHKNIIETNNIGVCVNADNKNAYWNGLQSIINNYDYYKNNIKSIKHKLSWNAEEKNLVHLYHKITLNHFTHYQVPDGLRFSTQTPISIDNSCRECIRCVMNNDVDHDIYFNEDGLCNHCVLYDKLNYNINIDAQQKAVKFNSLIEKIKKAGAGKKYDCIIGLSGGLDSTYVAYLTKQAGLRPLAVHLDNGWNSELAVKNIENIVTKLGIDLYTHVINWEEFRDLQLSYLKASVVDLEVTSDHAIVASLYNLARKHGIKYILSGESQATEGMLPESWNYLKSDLINLNAIHNEFGSVPLKTYPQLGYLKKLSLQKIFRIEYIKLLDYVNYVKKEALVLMQQELNWRDYGGKHYESIITRFYQSYILPTKFHIDKRYSHYSTLICGNQMTKEEAKKLLQLPTIDEKTLREDKAFIIKKFGLTPEQFEQIIKSPAKKHTDYNNIIRVIRKYRPYINVAKKLLRLSSESPYKIKRNNSIALLCDTGKMSASSIISFFNNIIPHYPITLFDNINQKKDGEEFYKGIVIKHMIDIDAIDEKNKNEIINLADQIGRYGFEAVYCVGINMLELAHYLKKWNPNITVVFIDPAVIDPAITNTALETISRHKQVVDYALFADGVYSIKAFYNLDFKDTKRRTGNLEVNVQEILQTLSHTIFN